MLTGERLTSSRVLALALLVLILAAGCPRPAEQQEYTPAGGPAGSAADQAADESGARGPAAAEQLARSSAPTGSDDVDPGGAAAPASRELQQQWWGEGCDPYRQGYTAHRGPAAPPAAWTYDTGRRCCGQLSLGAAGEVLLTLTEAPDRAELQGAAELCIVDELRQPRSGELLAVGADGRELWRYGFSGSPAFAVATSPAAQTYCASSWAGLRTVTARTGVSYDLVELSGQLECLGPAGERRWLLELDGAVLGRPLVTDGGRVLLAAVHTEFGERDEYQVQARLWCIEADGTTAWTKLLPDVKSRRDELNAVIAKLGTGLTAASQPVLTRSGWLVFGWNDEQYYRYSLEGRRDWEYAFMSRPDCAAAVSPNGNIVVLANDRPHLDERQLALINREAMNNYGVLHTLKEAGSMRWDWQVGSDVHTAAAVDQDGTIHFGVTLYEDNKEVERAYGRVHAFQADKKPKWQFDTRSAFDDHPRSPDPLIDVDGVLYIADGGRHLYAINPDGTLKWEYASPQGFATNPVIAADGMLYIGGNDGMLYALRDSSS